MKRRVLISATIVLLLATLFVGPPWFYAYRSYVSASGYLGVESNKQIRFVYVDKTHFDAYKTALWFDKSLSIVGQDGAIYCNGRQIDFPVGKNVALMRGPNDVIFAKLGPKYFREENGDSEVFYILGKVPHFKEKSMGMIDLQRTQEDHAMEQEWKAFLAIGQ